MKTAKESLIVALDGSPEQIKEWGSTLVGTVDWVKIGMTNFYSAGPDIVTYFKDRGFKVFLDLKMHDIPHQVEGGAYQLGKLGVDMFTVHATGGPDMIAKAVRGAAEGAQDSGHEVPRILAVTVLTSMDDTTLHELGVENPACVQVPLLARMSVMAGATGIVCSPLEAADVVAAIGPDKAVVTPGVRPKWSAKDDQSRITTPARALKNGATHLVVGRPITTALDIKQAAQKVLAEMEEG